MNLPFPARTVDSAKLDRDTKRLAIAEGVEGLVGILGFIVVSTALPADAPHETRELALELVREGAKAAGAIAAAVVVPGPLPAFYAKPVEVVLFEVPLGVSSVQNGAGSYLKFSGGSAPPPAGLSPDDNPFRSYLTCATCRQEFACKLDPNEGEFVVEVDGVQCHDFAGLPWRPASSGVG